MTMPVWKALTDAASTAAATCAPSSGGRPDTSAPTSARSSATRTTAIDAGESVDGSMRSFSSAANCAAITAPMRGDAEQAGGARDRVVDPGGDPGVLLVGVGEHRRRQRRDGRRQAEREHEQRGQQLGEVVGVGADPQHQQQARGGHQRPAAHERARAVAVRERARALGEQEHHRRGGSVAAPAWSAL